MILLLQETPQLKSLRLTLSLKLLFWYVKVDQMNWILRTHQECLQRSSTNHDLTLMIVGFELTSLCDMSLILSVWINLC